MSKDLGFDDAKYQVSSVAMLALDSCSSRLTTIAVASHNLLHTLYLVRVVCSYVENCPTPYVALFFGLLRG